MAAERIYPSLSNLQTRARTLSTVVEQREALYSAIGSGVVQPTSLDNTLRIARAKRSVSDSLNRHKSSLDSITNQIANYRDPEELIELAEIHLKEVEERSAKLRQLRSLSEHIEPAIITQFQAEFDELSSLPKTDANLKIGIDLLEQRRRAEREEKPKARVIIDGKQKTIDIAYPDGSKQTLRDLVDLDYAVLTYLASHARQRVTRHQIEQYVKSAGLKMISFGALLKYLRSEVEKDPKDPEIIRTTARGPQSAYIFDADVQITKERRKSRIRKVSEGYQGPGPVHESRIKTLDEIFLTRSETSLEDVIKLLGSARNGRPLTWVQAKSALKRAASLLYRRNINDTATEEERAAWRRLSVEYVQYSSASTPLEVKQFLLADIESYIQNGRLQGNNTPFILETLGQSSQSD